MGNSEKKKSRQKIVLHRTITHTIIRTHHKQITIRYYIKNTKKRSMFRNLRK